MPTSAIARRASACITGIEALFIKAQQKAPGLAFPRCCYIQLTSAQAPNGDAL
jgi:hypothetical protein